jgi:hypothetical protein
LDPCPDDWSLLLELFPELSVVLLFPLLPTLLFELPFLESFFTFVPEDVVLPIEVLDPSEVEDKSKLVKELRFITLFTKEVIVVVLVVVVVVAKTP